MTTTTNIKRSLLDKANTSKSSVKVIKSKLHILYDKLSVMDYIPQEMVPELKSSFYFSEWNKLYAEGNIKTILRHLQLYIEAKYKISRCKEGLMLMGYNNNEALAEIEEYKAEIKESVSFIFSNYKVEIAAARNLQKSQTTAIESHSEGTDYSIEVRPFIEDVYVSTTGNKPYIQAKDYIYTKKFAAFLNNETENLSKTNVKQIQQALSYLRTEYKEEIAAKLYWVVGKTKTNKLLGRGENAKTGKNHVSALLENIVESNRGKFLFFPNIYDSLIVSKDTKSAILKEMKKLSYQLFKNDIVNYFVDASLEEEVNYDLLKKYHILLTETELTIIKIDVRNSKINADIIAGNIEGEITEPFYKKINYDKLSKLWEN